MDCKICGVSYVSDNTNRLVEPSYKFPMNEQISAQKPDLPGTDPEGPPVKDPQPTDPYPVTDPVHDPDNPEPFPTPPEPIPELPPDITYKMWSEIRAGLEEQRPTGKLTLH